MASNGVSHPDYGIDAPDVVRMMFVLGAAAPGIAGCELWFRPNNRAIAFLFWPSLAYAALLVALGCYMIYSSKIGKVRGRDALLNLIPWSGNEVVLDVGCGRGLLLVAAAKRVPIGRVIGIDIWQAKDQTGNCAAAALFNAKAEGVDHRVEIQTADMRRLPFADASFDVVVSHWAVHNLSLSADRSRAIGEMARVTKPGGYILLADIQFRKQYASEFVALGFGEVRLVVRAVRDLILAVVTNGHFRPIILIARKTL